MIVPVILSGGSGTRLWPLSRPKQPKQLLAMVDERTMLRATFDRLDGIPDMVDPWVVCNADHQSLVAKELFAAGFLPDNVILEPVGRNTAPAAAAAALLIAERNPDALMLLLPADHVMRDESAFHSAVVAAVELSASGKLATFGIVPNYPETGYGYIEIGDRIGDTVAEVAKFVEKPDYATAQDYIAAGNYLWNSGMFLFRVSRYIEELTKFAPEMTAAVQTAVDEADRSQGIVLDATAFASSPSDSIDFAVMEHTDSAVVVPLDAGWSDVGSWSAVWELAAVESADNVFVGDVAAVDVTGSYLRSESRLVAAIGVENLVVVETSDAVMVASRERSQDVKAMVELLRDRQRTEAESHRSVAEPWGSTEVLIDTGPFILRHITVEPNSAGHIHLAASDRPRTWIVAAGSGTLEVEGEPVDISSKSAEIPPGAPVEVGVEGDNALEILEITRSA
ncbi:MAG: mannose-1-phosphate guanylyltransferase/mannose-6-phosphate isomerase [bacterium]|nr:mannose-1-phosphate guanylyltransferase/mannose-6-phosphate isomerase [bacterium]